MRIVAAAAGGRAANAISRPTRRVEVDRFVVERCFRSSLGGRSCGPCIRETREARRSPPQGTDRAARWPSPPGSIEPLHTTPAKTVGGGSVVRTRTRAAASASIGLASTDPERRMILPRVVRVGDLGIGRSSSARHAATLLTASRRESAHGEAAAYSAADRRILGQRGERREPPQYDSVSLRRRRSRPGDVRARAPATRRAGLGCQLTT